ncbi:DDT domain-containing protein PTM-like [Andrographis paniculata]|uniref:DDT domain-containing protein PTM-like n=1 Tax=Andrographis paniculata TaxID=175694 RepID=UPI0021E969BC|nr:DDT domain-containing protein PTM-like [Andrographis paniculata]XP_051113197.1 DDT domain-containing protein PTM-like [Andrographis paniculata]XP_051113198.1 DDT domain-containing protein PTM-like [Andrographis paniculata]
MEPVEVLPPKRRGRKRKIIEGQDASVDCSNKRKTVETRSLKLVGRYVVKEFQSSGLFLGKITFYESGLYRIIYDDGDCEDLYSGEVKAFLVEEGDLAGEWSERKEKLDEFLLGKEVGAKNTELKDAPELVNVNLVSSSVIGVSNNMETCANEVIEVHGNNTSDTDSSSDSCEDAQDDDSNLDMEDTFVPKPEFPPSSGHIGVPNEYVSHLLSVYGFLRSFSIPLFLYPFSLDDFVGALNCSVANTLLDSVHIALLHVLQRHLERLSSDGLELAHKCLRCLDWNLLDTFTWPVYTVHYLMVMGCLNAPELKGFPIHCLERDYYTLSAGTKLIVLQILCDDVLDSELLRVEMDRREELEVGIDIDSSTVFMTTGDSRGFHPRCSKTTNNIEAIQVVSENHQMKHSLGVHSTQTSRPAGSSADEDGNGDECRICGMEGLLLCCDGCPSSYHTRCLGLNKMHMPVGTWYCPECKISATQPKLLQGTILRGGQCFGVDPYGQAFVATCDHLLILDAPIRSGVCLRYYNRHDVLKFLLSLSSKVEHLVAYSEILRGILQYFEIPESILPCYGISGVGMQMEKEKEVSKTACHLDNLLGKSAVEIAEVENSGSCTTHSSAADMVSSSVTKYVQEPVIIGGSLDMGTKSDQLAVKGLAEQYSCVSKDTVLQEPITYSGLPGQASDTNDLSQQSTSSVNGIAACARQNGNIDHSGPFANGLRESKLSILCLDNKVDKMSNSDPYDACLFKGSFFKPTGYINSYAHGYFAASAASNLAILSSEENQVSESRPYNRRKGMLDNVSLQVKAFSSVAVRFFWPNTEKKLYEVPRERCSWCFSCKATVSSKRGCLLNAAASNSTRGATKVPCGVRLMKSGDGRLSGIAAYIIFMEESLGGLVEGPFLNDTFRKKWRKLAEQATTCKAVKILLLELEENIRTIALSGDWIKLVDSSFQSSTSQITANAAGSAQKRRPGRRGRKPSAVVEEISANYKDMSPDFTWWRGGVLSKLMFQRGILPCSMIRKAARQGGLKKIIGIHYVEGHESSRMSRQLIWRSAVEMSRNLAQIALQVRYLDFHVRWSDLVHPEQNLVDGKGPDAEVSAFRNAFISEKKIVGHDTRYCVDFGSQKHLPSRVMKYVAEVEKILEDGKERFWFSETRIPLYLIRDYEEKVVKNKTVEVFSKLQRWLGKGSRKNIYPYLWRKQDNLVRNYCPSCHEDVLHRNAVKCSACQGSCHEQCTNGLAVEVNEGVEFLITCKKCCESRVITHVQSSYGSPTSPLLLQTQDLPNGSNTNIHVNSIAYKQPQAPVPIEISSEKKLSNGSAVAKKTKNKHWGLIWRKKNAEENGADFRLKNILMRGKSDRGSTEPVCRLCNQPYNPDLIYICCETCQHWYHADAVELDESKISMLMGFKCSKCRRIRSPVCPYLDPEKKKALENRIDSRAPKVDNIEKANDSCLNSKYLKKEGPSSLPPPMKAEFHHQPPADDRRHPCVPQVGKCSNTPMVDSEWNSATLSNSASRKLPVRRHLKQENDTADPFQIGASVVAETEKLPVRRYTYTDSATDRMQVEAPKTQLVNSDEKAADTLEYDDCLQYDGAEFEPQTYFSFDELLASDDGGNGSYVFPENETLEISYDQEEPVISVDVVPCKFCARIDPFPDLCCKACGMWLHGHCSPWVESSSSSSWEDGWRCGNCREWR